MDRVRLKPDKSPVSPEKYAQPVWLAGLTMKQTHSLASGERERLLCSKPWITTARTTRSFTGEH